MKVAELILLLSTKPQDAEVELMIEDADNTGDVESIWVGDKGQVIILGQP